MPSPTQWNNADNKQPASWTHLGKVATNWQNGDVKSPTGWSGVTKSPADFNANIDGRQPYLYTDAFKKYVDPLRTYVYVAAAKSPTTWSPVTT